MLTSLIGDWGNVLAAIGAALTTLVGIFMYGRSKKKEGALEATTRAVQADAKKLEKARESVHKEKRDVAGVSDSDLIDRLRRRSDDWGSL